MYYMYTALQRFVRQVKSSYAVQPPPQQTVLTSYLNLSPRCIELMRLLTEKDHQSYTSQYIIVNILSLIIKHAPVHLRGVSSNICRLVLRTHVKNLYRLLGADDPKIPLAPLNFLINVLKFAKKGGPGASALLRELVSRLDNIISLFPLFLVSHLSSLSL